MPQARLLDRAARERAARLHHHLERVFARVVGRAHRRPTVPEEARAGDEDVDQARDEEGRAQPRDVEHAEGASGPGGVEPAHDHVRARADERAEAAQDDRIVHRHEQPRDAQPLLAGPVPDRGHHERHHGRVVHEGREDARHDHRPQLGRGERLRTAEDPAGDAGERSGAVDGGGDHEQGRDRHHPLVAHAAERLGGGEDPGRQQHHHAADHRHVGRPTDHEHRRERGDDDAAGEECLPVGRECGWGRRGHSEPPGGARRRVPLAALSRCCRRNARPDRVGAGRRNAGFSRGMPPR